MNLRFRLVATLITIAVATSCAPNLAGEPYPVPTTQTPHPTTTSNGRITATDVCKLMTPADFPYQGPETKPAELDEEPFPDCGYQMKPSPDISSVLTVGLTFLPDRKLEPFDFDNRREITVDRKRGVLGQGKLTGNSGRCELIFETPRGLWRIIVVDSSAPGRDGCATAKHIGDRVAPRVP
ncbi:DUF3558 family protein [Allokutzneria sp. A3M-2-11 16]|uniref:DUF3558 family protein n=1 Tax=Allokutzneria sp. A3M-2-11 16 TaxID=2962043 RepID=UPI0020B6D89B|nr:DUF3558 family protein [Allokutzneria sp. A3M-2-11 16]MCP3801694.1 DUF3558 family protein [Allokutzneria sp. A3M-2-11 16]